MFQKSGESGLQGWEINSLMKAQNEKRYWNQCFKAESQFFLSDSLLRKADHGCACVGFLTDFTDTLECFHAVHLGNIKKQPSVKTLQLLYVYSNN